MQAETRGSSYKASALSFPILTKTPNIIFYEHPISGYIRTGVAKLTAPIRIFDANA
jgi:hypothetical protein